MNEYAELALITMGICLCIGMGVLFAYSVYQQSIGTEVAFTAKVNDVAHNGFKTILTLGNGTSVTFQRCILPNDFVLNTNYRFTVFVNLNGDISLETAYRIKGEP